MIELAQHYGEEEMEIKHVARLHNQPVVVFERVAEQLEKTNLIVRKCDGKLSLKLSPEKITIWQVVASVSVEETYNKRLPRQIKTSTVIMIRKEGEALQNIISSKLKRHKLSEWSEKANKTVYI